MKFKFYILIFFIFLFVFYLFILNSCHPKFNFNFNFNDVDIQPWTILKGSIYNEQAIGMCKDPNGNIYIVGNTTGSFDGQINSGGFDFFIIKFNSNGTHLWTIFKGSSYLDCAYGIAYDPNGYICIIGYKSGSFDGQTNSGNEDIFVVKFDLNGNHIWTKFIGISASDYGRGIIIDNYGNIYIAGSTLGNLFAPPNGMNDLFFAKLDSNGNTIWGIEKGSINNDNGISLVFDNNYNIYITGNTEGSFDSQTNNGSSDIFVMKYSNINSTPIHEWTIFKGSNSYDYIFSIILDTNNNIYISGSAYGSIDSQINNGSGDLLICKLNSSNGATIFTRLRGSSQDDAFFNLYIYENYIYLTGYANGPFDGQVQIGGTDIVILKYDLNGNYIQSRIIGTIENESSCSIFIDNYNYLYIFGKTSGNLNNLQNNGETDIFIIKMN